MQLGAKLPVDDAAHQSDFFTAPKTNHREGGPLPLLHTLIIRCSLPIASGLGVELR